MKKDLIKKILIVEDDIILVKTLERELRQYSCKIFTAATGKEALAITKDEKPDLVLLDLIMPEMDGFEFLKKIRSSKKTKDIPVVVISNLSEDTAKKRVYELGILDYHIKAEVDLNNLSAQVTKILKI